MFERFYNRLFTPPNFSKRLEKINFRGKVPSRFRQFDDVLMEEPVILEGNLLQQFDYQYLTRWWRESPNKKNYNPFTNYPISKDAAGNLNIQFNSTLKAEIETFVKTLESIDEERQKAKKMTRYLYSLQQSSALTLEEHGLLLKHENLLSQLDKQEKEYLTEEYKKDKAYKIELIITDIENGKTYDVNRLKKLVRKFEDLDSEEFEIVDEGIKEKILQSINVQIDKIVIRQLTLGKSDADMKKIKRLQDKYEEIKNHPVSNHDLIFRLLGNDKLSFDDIDTLSGEKLSRNKFEPQLAREEKGLKFLIEHRDTFSKRRG